MSNEVKTSLKFDRGKRPKRLFATVSLWKKAMHLNLSIEELAKKACDKLKQ